MTQAPTVITADNKGPIVNVVQWLFMVAMILATGTKLYNRWRRLHRWMMDDFLLIVAMFLAIGQTVAVSEQVPHGLGKSPAELSAVDLAIYQKTAYASQLLYISALCCVKLGFANFLKNLAPLHWVHISMLAFTFGLTAWTVVALFVVAFQCGVPQPWNFDKAVCVSQTAFWASFGTFDIITDLVLIIVPVQVISTLQASIARRVSTMAPFLLRAINIPLIILRVVFIALSAQSGRSGMKELRAALLTEIHLHTAIILSCAPFIKSVLDAMQNGMLASDIPRALSSSQSSNTKKILYPFSYLTRSIRRPGATRSQALQSDSLERLSNNQPGVSGSAHAVEESLELPGRPQKADSIPPNDINVRTTITTTLDRI